MVSGAASCALAPLFRRTVPTAQVDTFGSVAAVMELLEALPDDKISVQVCSLPPSLSPSLPPSLPLSRDTFHRTLPSCPSLPRLRLPPTVTGPTSTCTT